MSNRRGFIQGAVIGVGAMSITSRPASAAAKPKMSLNVVYPRHDGARFDLDYYRKTHIPMAMKVMQADRVLLIEGVPNGDKPAPYAMICHFEFATPEALQTALKQPGMADVRADVANFTDIKPAVMLGRSS